MGVPLHKKLVETWQRWAGTRVANEVPLEDACCEFGCRETDCRLDRWIECENRLAYIARNAPSGRVSVKKLS